VVDVTALNVAIWQAEEDKDKIAAIELKLLAGFQSFESTGNMSLCRAQHKRPMSPAQNPEFLKDKRRATLDWIASAHLASMGDTVADTVGQGVRQQLVW